MFTGTWTGQYLHITIPHLHSLECIILCMNVILYFSCSHPPNREDTPTPQPSDKASSINQTPVEANEFPQLPEGLEKKPIVLKFSAVMDGITIGAALLPSLKAEYKMGRMKSHGMTGERESRVDAEFHHFVLWFTTLQLYFYILHLLWWFIKMSPCWHKDRHRSSKGITRCFFFSSSCV